jgi:hypothetical protein
MPTLLIPGSSDLLNLTEIMISKSELFTFHVIVGAVGVGKSVALELAAAEASKTRAVKYLAAPPTDLELFKLFYDPPWWLPLQLFRDMRPCVCLVAIANIFVLVLVLYTRLSHHDCQLSPRIFFAADFLLAFLALCHFVAGILCRGTRSRVASVRILASGQSSLWTIFTQCTICEPLCVPPSSTLIGWRLIKIVLAMPAGEVARQMLDYSSQSRATVRTALLAFDLYIYRIILLDSPISN